MLIEPLALLTDNYSYLVICEETGQAAVVDPAEAEPVLAAVARRGVTLTSIWSTHHHHDHTAGNAVLSRQLNLSVYGHRTNAGRISALTHPVDDGAIFRLGNLIVRASHAPGHTMGDLVYLVSGSAFTGDVLFGAGCGRLFEGDAATMYRSLTTCIASLPPETMLYCGHEYTLTNLEFTLTIEPANIEVNRCYERVYALRARDEPSVPLTLSEELQTNPFLRASSSELRAQLMKRFPEADLSDPVRVFALIRQLRDNY